MKHPQSMIVAAFAALLFAVAPATVHAQAEGVTVAVVDIKQVFNNLDEREDIVASVQSQVQELQQWEQQQKESLQDLQMDLDLLKPGSEEYLKTREELRRKVIELRVELEVKQRQLEAEQSAQMEMLYRKVLDGVARVAQDEGVQLVLMKDSTPQQMQNANAQQIMAMVESRKVLYAADELDMTEQVQRKLNAEYELTPNN